jgi:hypothetical protein
MQALMDYLDGVASLAPAPGARTARRMWSWRPVRAVVFVAGAAAAAFALFVAAANAQSAQVGPMPAGWHAVGGATGDYALGADLSRRDGGQGLGGGTIRSLVGDPRGFASMQQSIRADLYRGQRVRLSGFVKTGAPMTGTAALWMRVDGPARSESNDYMKHRPVAQATDWARYDVVLDVPRDAVGISFGVLLDGPGQVWLDDVALEPVGRDVALTGSRGQVVPAADGPGAPRQEARRRHAQAAEYRVARLRPVNLSFARGVQTP